MYAATKHALRAMTEGLRLEARQKGVPLKVSLVSPGRIDTEFFDALFPGRAPPPPGGGDGPAPALSAADVADAVVFALTAPPGVDVCDIMVRPLGQVG